MEAKKEYTGLLKITVAAFILEKIIAWLFGLGKFNFVYVIALLLSLGVICVSWTALRRNKAKEEILSGNWPKYVGCILVLSVLYSGGTILDRTALRYCYSIEFQPLTENKSLYPEIWDNHQYVYLVNNQVFDIHNETIITYEEYVRKFQDSYYTKTYDEKTATVVIQKDDVEWFSFRPEDEIEELRWSPKQNYLLVNYKNNTLPQLLDVKNRTMLQMPVQDGILGPSIGKGPNGTIYEEYVEQIFADFNWNSQEDQAIIYLRDTGGMVSWGSNLYWNLKDNYFKYYRILDIHGPSLRFDKAGDLLVTEESLPAGKWINNWMIMSVGSTGRSLSFARAWVGGYEIGVDIYGRSGRQLNIIPYRAYHFDTFSEDNLFGYIIKNGEIEKYRFRWFSLFYP